MKKKSNDNKIKKDGQINLGSLGSIDSEVAKSSGLLPNI